jgi:hypothetical protein
MQDVGTKGEKQQRLAAFLRSLPADRARVLAQMLVALRDGGDQSLPTEFLLGALQVRTDDSARTPNLRRLVCDAIEHFLTDEELEMPVAGLVPRGLLRPWWEAVGTVDPDRLRTLEDDLARRSDRDAAVVEEVAAAARAAACVWTDRLIEALQHRRSATNALPAVIRHPPNRPHLEQIAAILRVAEPLTSAMRRILDSATREHQLDAAGRKIADFTPYLVTVAKDEYKKLSEDTPSASHLLALALLNRLVYPWQVLRLPTALTLQRDDRIMHNTEVAVVADRLVDDLCRIAAEADARAPRPRDDAGTVDIERLREIIGRFATLSQGLLSELNFHRDSRWGQAIMGARRTMQQAFERSRLGPLEAAVLGIVPLAAARSPGGSRFRRQGGAGTGGPDLGYRPTDEAVASVQSVCRFLTSLVHHGERHGFAVGARAAIADLGQELERRADRLLGELRDDPENGAVAAQLDAAAAALRALTGDERGDLVARRRAVIVPRHAAAADAVATD